MHCQLINEWLRIIFEGAHLLKGCIILRNVFSLHPVHICTTVVTCAILYFGFLDSYRTSPTFLQLRIVASYPLTILIESLTSAYVNKTSFTLGSRPSILALRSQRSSSSWQSSGCGTLFGIGHWWEGCQGSGVWNEHIIIKITLPFWMALTRPCKRL